MLNEDKNFNLTHRPTIAETFCWRYFLCTAIVLKLFSRGRYFGAPFINIIRSKMAERNLVPFVQGCLIQFILIQEL